MLRPTRVEVYSKPDSFARIDEIRSSLSARRSCRVSWREGVYVAPGEGKCVYAVISSPPALAISSGRLSGFLFADSSPWLPLESVGEEEGRL